MEISIGYENNILSIGSCFAENMAAYLQKGKFHIETNPFGILYNPVSIAETLDYLWSEKKIDETKLVKQGELWHSFLHHGSFVHFDKTTLLNNLNDNLTEHRVFAKKTNRIILTLGTANVFIFRENNQIVANCHKIPNSFFEKRRLNIEECVIPFISIFEKMKRQNPDIEIMLSVSPIRHIRDGLIENQRSKATILLAVDQLCEMFSFVHYFPAYEIVMDDLRDYRFFKADMIHPNEVAIEYIWEKFSYSFFEEETKLIYKEINELQSALAHRPLFPESKEYQLFIDKTKQRQKALEEKYPHLNW